MMNNMTKDHMQKRSKDFAATINRLEYNMIDLESTEAKLFKKNFQTCYAFQLKMTKVSKVIVVLEDLIEK